MFLRKKEGQEERREKEGGQTDGINEETQELSPKFEFCPIHSCRPSFSTLYQ